MDKKKLKVYTCSNVGMDYFIFLGRTIAAAGFDVEPLYLTSEGNYRKLAKSKGFPKIWLRIKMYLLYPFYLLFKATVAEKNSVFVVSSNTFFAPYLVRLILKIKSGKVIHLLYDLYPDAIEIAGLIRRESFTSNIIGKIIKNILSKCDATVYLGGFLKVHAESRWGKAPVSDVIDISTDLGLYSKEFSQDIKGSKIILHYGGQLGHLHDAPSLIESIKYVCKSDIGPLVEFNFYVSGAQAQFVETSLSEYPVKIISAVPSAQWRNDIQNFHIGLVSLSPGGASVCLPNKTYGMMAGGMAILTIAPHWSDLAALVNSLDAGWIINNAAAVSISGLQQGEYFTNLQKNRPVDEVAQDFYRQLSYIIRNQEELRKKRSNAFNNVRSVHGIELLASKWGKLINNI
jgi:hypothetical protein